MFAGALVILFYPCLWVKGKVSQILLHQEWQQRVGVAHPEAVSHVFGRLIIPKLVLDEIVLDNVTEKDLAAGPGHHPDTSGNGAGNCVIFGHLNVDGSPFRDLSQLARGDLVDLQTDVHLVQYKVDHSKIVAATDVEILDPGGSPQLTLVTCMPGARQRYVVTCRKVKDVV